MNSTTIRTSPRTSARGLLGLVLAPLLGILVESVALPASAATSRPELTGVVNINTASADELQLLPGVGKSRAGAIVKLRQERGGFKRADDLTQVGGIGEAMLESMRPHVTLIGKTTARRGSSGGGRSAQRDAPSKAKPTSR
jgi:competence ComEA-like helix-hairpin-helix protein